MAGMEYDSSFPELSLLSAYEERARWERQGAEATEQQKGEMIQAVEPVPIDKPATSFVTPLTHLAQKKKVPFKFDFKQITEQTFIGELHLGDKVLTTGDSYSSKKGAKEAVAALGVQHLQSLPLQAPQTQHKLPAAFEATTDVVSQLAVEVQKHAIALPTYDFQEVGQQQFSSSLVILGVTLREEGPYANKKDAKVAVAKRGLALLQEHTKYLELTLEEAKAEPWISILYGYVNSDGVSYPNYQFYSLKAKFSCEVRIRSRDEPFGSKTQGFRSQKLARQIAARQAVQWLRQTGKLNEEDRPVERRKSDIAVPTNGSDENIFLNDKDKSYRQKVAEFCNRIGINAPEYQLIASDGAFYTCSAFLKRDPQVSQLVPVGHVENVHGQKKAKEECAKEVLRYLEAYAENTPAVK